MEQQAILILIPIFWQMRNEWCVSAIEHIVAKMRAPAYAYASSLDIVFFLLKYRISLPRKIGWATLKFKCNIHYVCSVKIYIYKAHSAGVKGKNMLSHIFHFLQESVLKFINLTYPHVLCSVLLLIT